MAMDGDQPVAGIGPGAPRDWLIFLHVAEIQAAAQATVVPRAPLPVRWVS